MQNQDPSRRPMGLLEFARLTNNSDLSSALIEIAAAVESQNLASEHFSEAQMSKAVELIVDGYVCMNDREALEDLERNRRQLASHLRHRSRRLDTDATLREIEQEIGVIQAGLARLASAV